MGKSRWAEENVRSVVASSTTMREALSRLGLVEAGGNYTQLRKYLVEYGIDKSHFLGSGWSRAKKLGPRPLLSLEEVMVEGSNYQSHKLKKRLFLEKIKEERCEECDWCERADDGRLPLELDHINGDRTDNRLENLRVLCPNCHSLKPTHRGLNRKRA